MSVKFPVRLPAGIDVMLIFDVSLVCLWYLAGPRCFGQVVPTETLARCGSKDDTAQIKRNKQEVGILHPSPNRASVRRFTSVYGGALSKAFCFTCVSHLSIFRFLRGKQSLLPTASSQSIDIMSIYSIYLHTRHIFCMCFLVVRRMKRNVLCDFPGLGFHGGRLRELRVASRQISLRRAPAPLRRTREFRVGLARLHQPKPWRRPWDLNGAESNSSNSFHSLLNSLLN